MAAVRVLIRIEDDERAAELTPWLLDDPVARDVRLVPAPDESGAMGPGETIEAIVSNGTAVAGLVVAIASWLEARRSRVTRSAVHLERNGRRVTITGDDPAEVERVVRALTEPDPPADDG